MTFCAQSGWWSWASPYVCFCRLSNWIISFSASLLPSVRLQYGCTALQTAPGKRPQVALFLYISMLNQQPPLTPYPCTWVRATRCILLFFPFFSFISHFSVSLDICFAHAVIFLSFHPSAQTLQSVHPSRQAWWATWPEHGPYWSACDQNEVFFKFFTFGGQNSCKVWVFCNGRISSEQRNGIETSM